MKDNDFPGDLPITPKALRALNEWEYRFGGNLCQCAIELACQADSGSVITLEVVEQAVPSACRKTAAAVSSPSSARGQQDGARGKVA
ncbi:MAG: hypothetical protein ABIP48_07220 [Planctomycetota bacterium]